MPDSEPEETDAIALSVVVNSEAPTDLQSFARQYWELSGIDVGSGEPQWRFKTTNLNFELWSGTAHYTAAAGAMACMLVRWVIAKLTNDEEELAHLDATSDELILPMTLEDEVPLNKRRS